MSTTAGDGGGAAAPAAEPRKTSVEEDLISAAAVMTPLTGFLYAHKRGYTVKMLNLVYRTVGVWGFPFLPLITISFEKCIYDSVRSLQGYDPTIIRESRKNEGWPSGGAAALPNLSLFPVSQRNDHTDADVGAHAAAAAGTSAAGAAGAASHLAESTGGGDVVGGGIGTGGSTPTTSSDKFPGGSCTG